MDATSEAIFRKRGISVEIGFIYGALSDPLEKQANEQGFTLGDKREHLETLSRAMVVCRINGLCTDSQYDAMCKKMQKKVVKALKPLKCHGEGMNQNDE